MFTKHKVFKTKKSYPNKSNMGFIVFRKVWTYEDKNSLKIIAPNLTLTTLKKVGQVPYALDLPEPKSSMLSRQDSGYKGWS